MIAAVVVAGVVALAVVESRRPAAPAASPRPSRSSYVWATPEPPVPVVSPPVPPLPAYDIPDHWTTWAVLDRTTGKIVEWGGNPGTSTTESMIKAAIGFQYLLDLKAAGRSANQAETEMISRMIRDSNNEDAETLYRRGGREQMLRKVVDRCHLLSTTLVAGWWSETHMNAADAARLGACIAADQTPETAWLLQEMRQVRGEGRFGIIEVRPTDQGQPLAIKNGWNLRPDGWHSNCLAIAHRWTMAVMTRYPAYVNGKPTGMAYGAGLCAKFAASVAPPAEPSPRPARAFD